MEAGRTRGLGWRRTASSVPNEDARRGGKVPRSHQDGSRVSRQRKDAGARTGAREGDRVRIAQCGRHANGSGRMAKRAQVHALRGVGGSDAQVTRWRRPPPQCPATAQPPHAQRYQCWSGGAIVDDARDGRHHCPHTARAGGRRLAWGQAPAARADNTRRQHGSVDDSAHAARTRTAARYSKMGESRHAQSDGGCWVRWRIGTPPQRPTQPPRWVDTPPPPLSRDAEVEKRAAPRPPNDISLIGCAKLLEVALLITFTFDETVTHSIMML